jgi:branched-chain amino acid transport system permease protein
MKTLPEQLASVPRSSAVRPGVMLLPWLIALVAAVAINYGLPAIVDDYWVSVLRRAGVFVIAAISLNMVNGYAGQFSMGHAGFMAVGAYVAGAVTYYGSLLFHGSLNDPAFFYQGNLLMLGGIALGALAAAGAGYLVGLPSLRLRGDYLAIVTLGFGEIIRVILELTLPQMDSAEAVRAAPLKTLISLNGATGFFGIPTYAGLFWIWLFVGITAIIAYRVKLSSSGRAFLSIREDEIAARAMGIDLTKYKVRAFVLAAFFGGIAGALSAHTGANPSPTDAGFQRSFDIIIFVVLGGLGSLSGAAIAALVLTLLAEVLRGPEPVLNAWWFWLIASALLAAGAFILKAKRNNGYRVLIVGAVIPIALLAFAFLAKAVKDKLGIDLANYRMILYALLLILVMLLRPNGLLGVREIWDLFGPIDETDRRRKSAAKLISAASATTGGKP